MFGMISYQINAYMFIIYVFISTLSTSFIITNWKNIRFTCWVLSKTEKINGYYTLISDYYGICDFIRDNKINMVLAYKSYKSHGTTSHKYLDDGFRMLIARKNEIYQKIFDEPMELVYISIAILRYHRIE
jgi:hypothetical protein